MSRIAEIIEAGKAPGFQVGAKDPQGPDMAVPRALKQLEEKHSARRIAKDAGWSVETLKKTWNI